MNTLQKALLANGIFSLVSGITLIVFFSLISQWFEVPDNSVFWITGSVLIGFAITVLVEVKKQRPVSVLIIIMQDLIWVIVSFVILIAKPFTISALGNQTILIVALIVFFFAITQAKGLSSIDSTSSKKMKKLSYNKVMNASKAKTWSIISDVANYHIVAPNIDSVKILSGEGEGMKRSCSHGKDSWTETCTLWKEEQAYSFEVNTSAPDYLYPFSYFKGTWVLEENSADQTKVIMIFHFQYEKRIYNIILHPFLKSKFNKVCDKLLSNWEEKIKE
jgi:ribosome-associated toxin RatA of RatAB toxin-antitoxin module